MHLSRHESADVEVGNPHAFANNLMAAIAVLRQLRVHDAHSKVRTMCQETGVVSPTEGTSTVRILGAKDAPAE